MKKFILSLLAIIVSLPTYSQIKFEKGYYISNDGNKVECLIKNMDWENNPTEFLYKQAEDAEPKRATIEEVKEFGVYNISRYVRATVDIDQSSNDISKLSTMRAPEFSREEIFLKVLVEGKANLYVYVGKNIKRFFYETDEVPVEQLIYKSFRSGESINQNYMFRQQLINTFHCDALEKSRIENLDYSQRDLTKLFLQYNACLDVEPANFTNKQKRDAFNLWLRPRVALSSASAFRDHANVVRDLQFEQQATFSAGIEAEFILPFNKNKWAIIAEPTYQSYEASISSEPVRIDYQALELPIGVRHYFFLNSHSKLSLAAAFQLNFPSNSTFVHMTNITWEITRSANMAFEVGYILKNRLTVAYRYQTSREMVSSNIWNVKFETMAFVVGYSIL